MSCNTLGSIDTHLKKARHIVAKINLNIIQFWVFIQLKKVSVVSYYYSSIAVMILMYTNYLSLRSTMLNVRNPRASMIPSVARMYMHMSNPESIFKISN